MISVTVTNRTWTGWPVETLTGEYPTVGGLKRELLLASGILYRRQLLVHDGKLMHDDAAHPSHYGVGDGASIDLHLKLPMRESVTFRIEYHDTTISMALESNTMINHLRKPINYYVGLPPHRQRLTYMGALMRDGDLLRDYLINETPTEAVQLVELPRDERRIFNLEVRNTHNGEFEIMTVDPLDTAGTVVMEMRRRGLNQEQHFIIAFTGHSLSVDTTLEDIGFPTSGTKLDLIYLTQ